MGARDLLARLADSGVTVAADGDRLLIRPASKLTDDMRGELRALKPEVLALLSMPARKEQAGTGEADRKERPDTGDPARFEARRARLIRWGWPPDEAQAMAERLARRDLSDDDRVSCAECASYRPGRCGNHRRAGLFGPELGHDLAALLQRCPGFKP